MFPATFKKSCFIKAHVLAGGIGEKRRAALLSCLRADGVCVRIYQLLLQMVAEVGSHQRHLHCSSLNMSSGDVLCHIDSNSPSTMFGLLIKPSLIFALITTALIQRWLVPLQAMQVLSQVPGQDPSKEDQPKDKLLKTVSDNMWVWSLKPPVASALWV